MKLTESGSIISPVSMLSSEWRKPFNISIGLHVIVLVLAVLAPDLFNRQPRLPEIYTVNLFTATEVAQPRVPAPVTKAAVKSAAPKIEPEAKQPVVSIQPSKPDAVPEVKTTVVKPISLEPLQQKLKIGKTKEEETLERAKLSRVVQKLKTSAAQKETREAADRAAKEAVSKLADVMKSSTLVTATSAKTSDQGSAASKATAIRGPRGTGIEPDFYMKQYLSAVYQQIHDHWVLPDLQNWDNSLEAVLVVTIRRDGTVTDTYFERKSDNVYFNQFVLKAVKDASPLPPFPDQLQENTFEIGLRFKPGELL